MTDFEDPRRDFLVKALTAGFYLAGTGLAMPAWGMGKVPGVLPPGKSIYDLKGRVKVNGQPATMDTFIGPQATVETGRNGRVIFAVGKDAFILRSNSKVKIDGGESIITGISLLAGKLLSVFGKRTRQQRLGVKTVSATIGIRGTGVYVESEPDQTYVCTCYGVADLAAINDKQSVERVVTQHHDAPRYILSNAPAGEKIKQAPVINHTDDELALIETLVGRSVPFAAAGDYGSPRKNSY